MKRGEDHHDWDMEKFLKALGNETELREEYQERPPKDKRPWKTDQWSTLFTGKESNCKKITGIKERKKLLLKFGSCYNCLRKGHLARGCKSSVKCSDVKASITKRCGVVGNSILDDRNSDQVNNSHVVTSTRVVFQTAKAHALGKSKRRVRVLFNTGSHESITAPAAAWLGLQALLRIKHLWGKKQ